MKLKTLLMIVIAALALSACGGGHKASTNPQVQAQETALTATAQRDIKRCLPVKDGAPDFLVLRSHAGRQQFENCAVPASKRVAFNACLTKLTLSGLPTKARLERGGEACLTKAES